MNEYTLDTNILIGLEQRYPKDVFPSAWQALENAVEQQSVCICEEMHEETYLGGDSLYKWAKEVTGMVCPTQSDEVALATSISNAHPEWVQQKQNAADPFLIAHASLTGRIVVTEERRAGPNVSSRNQKVPNVADKVGVETVNFIEFVRAQGWRF
ncbi:DUF4411 family protein [Kocuria himachalensis]